MVLRIQVERLGGIQKKAKLSQSKLSQVLCRNLIKSPVVPHPKIIGSLGNPTHVWETSSFLSMRSFLSLLLQYMVSFIHDAYGSHHLQTT